MKIIAPEKINVRHKRAEFDYEIVERFDAGIMLTGSEIKSIRNGGGSINESYCLIRDGEVFIKGMTIPEYSHGTYANHDPTRLRKLLLNKRELNRIEAKIRERGFTLIPIRLFMNERGFAKLEIALGRGKKHYDKRQSLKQKDTKREIEKVMKKYR
ncbi:MAG: SsrA-binding protein SmpB [Chitinophagales bacterium]|nr:SsrA-binding protein SmpB [Chitinophagales bacterium]